MQDKVMPEQVAIPIVYAGIDVCKDHLDLYLHPAALSCRVSNDAGGWRKLKHLLAQYPVERVVMEATSKYHRAAHRSLAAAGLAVAVINPLRARLFAEACGVLAKTDGIDARMLALLAERLVPDAAPPASEAVELLQEMVRARRGAVAERVAVNNRLEHAHSAFLRRELRRRLHGLDAHIDRLQAEIERIIVADPMLMRRHVILCSIPGIGSVTAITILANMDEIGQLDAKQATALAGLAPFANDSGPKQGNRRIRGGRPDLRQALYMAALSAARFNPDSRRFKLRLREKGKPPKVALIAVARKLLILANTLIRENRTWSPTHA